MTEDFIHGVPSFVTFRSAFRARQRGSAAVRRSSSLLVVRRRSSNDVPFDDAKDLGSYRTKTRTHGREVTSAFGSSTGTSRRSQSTGSKRDPVRVVGLWNTDRLVVASIVRFRRKEDYLLAPWARA